MPKNKPTSNKHNKTQFAVATRVWPDHAWTLPKNDIWNIPPEAIQAGELRGEITARGQWQMPISYKALAVVYDEKDTSHYGEHYITCKVYGMRTLHSVYESGYQLEGRVSIEGKIHRAFTSSIMFQTEEGKLIDVACLYVCVKD